MSTTAPGTGVLRLTRAAVLTLATVSLSLAAHLAAGGSAPGPVALLLVGVPVLAVSLLVTGRRLGRGALGALLGVTQVALHTAFMALCTDGGVAAQVTVGHHTHLVLDAPAGSAAGPSLAELALAGTTPAMTAAHVGAGVVVALLLARGEAALWALWSWLRPALPAAPGLPLVAAAPTASAPTTPRSADRRAGHRPRGPPLLLPPTAPSAGRLLVASA